MGLDFHIGRLGDYFDRHRILLDGLRFSRRSPLLVRCGQTARDSKAEVGIVRILISYLRLDWSLGTHCWGPCSQDVLEHSEIFDWDMLT